MGDEVKVPRWLICVLAGVATTIASYIGEVRGYREGQIDAANGIMKYELQTLPTGETVWRERKQ